MFNATQLCGFMAYTDATNPGAEAGTGAGGAACGVGDPYSAYVVLHMRFNNDFVDRTGNHAFTNTGASFEAGNYDERAVFASTDYVRSNATSSHLKLVGEFTIEFELTITNAQQFFLAIATQQDWDNTNYLCHFSIDSSSRLVFTWGPTGTGQIIGSVSSGNTYRVTVARNDAGRLGAWLDETLAIAYQSTDGSGGASNMYLDLGYCTYYGTSYPNLDFKIDELRITTKCRYDVTNDLPELSDMPFAG